MLRSLKSNTIGDPFIVLSTTESTNNYAMGQLQSGTAKHGTAWFAEEQTKGKGQRGRQWLSKPSENIILTVAIDTRALTLNNQFALSMCAALAAFDLFAKYAGDETSVKWPNDIYWRDRKAAGILIENIVQGTKWQWSVVGIGMNVNQTEFSEAAVRPVSLKQITGKDNDAKVLARELCACLENRWQELLSGENDLLQVYNERLFKKGETVKLKKENVVFEAKIEGVNAMGELEAASLFNKNFVFGEVEWVLGEREA